MSHSRQLYLYLRNNSLCRGFSSWGRGERIGKGSGGEGRGHVYISYCSATNLAAKGVAVVRLVVAARRTMRNCILVWYVEIVRLWVSAITMAIEVVICLIFAWWL